MNSLGWLKFSTSDHGVAGLSPARGRFCLNINSTLILFAFLHDKAHSKVRSIIFKEFKDVLKK